MKHVQPADVLPASSLHDLACTGATAKTGCVCVPRVSAFGIHRNVPDWRVVEDAAHNGIDLHLSNLESLLIALEQRDMTSEQLDRFARLLQYGERTALLRVRRAR